MIIGSIYLTKKAKKAYRKHQAEKAAQRLTEAVSVDDPSNELNLKAPPSSPTGSQLSLTSSLHTKSPSSAFSVSNVRASRSLSDLRSPSSQYSSYSKTASGVKEFEQFIRRQSNDYLHHTLEQPPSYDTVVSGSVSSQSQHAHPPTSESPLALSAGPAHPLLSSHQNMHAYCPSCSAILQQHQQHEHPGHLMTWRRSHHEHDPEGNVTTRPTISEMPDPSVYQRIYVAGPPRPNIEARDTAVHEMEAPIQPPEAIEAIEAAELPAEVPAVFSNLSIVDADEKHKETDKVNGLNATKELSD